MISRLLSIVLSLCFILSVQAQDETELRQNIADANTEIAKWEENIQQAETKKNDAMGLRAEFLKRSKNHSDDSARHKSLRDRAREHDETAKAQEEIISTAQKNKADAEAQKQIFENELSVKTAVTVKSKRVEPPQEPVVPPQEPIETEKPAIVPAPAPSPESASVPSADTTTDVTENTDLTKNTVSTSDKGADESSNLTYTGIAGAVAVAVILAVVFMFAMQKRKKDSTEQRNSYITRAKTEGIFSEGIIRVTNESSHYTVSDVSTLSLRSLSEMEYPDSNASISSMTPSQGSFTSWTEELKSKV